MLSAAPLAGTPIASAMAPTFAGISPNVHASGVITTRIPATAKASSALCGPVDLSTITRSGVRAIIFSATTWCPEVTMGTLLRSTSVLAISRPMRIDLNPIAEIISPAPLASATTFSATGLSLLLIVVARANEISIALELSVLQPVSKSAADVIVTTTKAITFRSLLMAEYSQISCRQSAA